MKNILVLDSSIMIQKIIKLAFPEDEYNLIFSATYPVAEEIPEQLIYVFVTADMPGEKDGYDIAVELKEKYNCPVLIMVPKFVSFNEEKFKKYNLDAYLEKPFTSEILKEAVGKLGESDEIAVEQQEEVEIKEIDNFADSELEDLSDEEFMISDEDLEGLSDEDLDDIDFDDDILEDINEEDENIIVENTEDVETAELDEPVADLGNDDVNNIFDVESGEETDGEDFSKPIVDENEHIEFQDEIEDEVLETEFDALSDELDDVSFDEEIGEDMEAIEFEEEDEELLEAEQAQVDVKEENAGGSSEELPVESDNAVDDVEFEVEEEPQTVQIDEYKLSESEISDEDVPPVPFTVGETTDYEEIEDIVDEVDENSEVEDEDSVSKDEEEKEEFIDDFDDNFTDDAIGLSMDESDVEIIGAPSGLTNPEDDTSFHKDIPEEEPVFDADEGFDGVGISEIMEEEEIIPAPSGIASPKKTGDFKLSDDDVKRIAKEVVNLISDKLLREVAWEVIPAVAEEVVKNRIKELEEEVE